ncbi:DUF2950 family protein [Mesorhizobium sp. WSM2239]|uniref:DUF2950 family protein n=2 Tax=unclassified Mesorhizobium TaxID=325217 RepID=A0AAU8DG30_9HYPH
MPLRWCCGLRLCYQRQRDCRICSDRLTRHLYEAGVRTLVVSHRGIVYEADLGPDTDAKVDAFNLFNPDDSWEVTGN